MNPDNAPPAPPEAPPTGPVLSAEEFEKLQKAARRLIAVRNEVLSMPQEQREWFFGKEGHSDSFDLAWWVNVNLSQLRAALTRRDARIRDLVGSVEYALNVLGTGACTANTCQGCHHEVNEAIESLRSAIDAAMKESVK